MVGWVRRFGLFVLSIAASIALAYTLFGIGFVICTTPQATQAIGGTFSGWEHAPYPEDEMAEIAEAVRSFSVDGTSAQDMYDTIYDILEDIYPEIAQAFEDGSLEDTAADLTDSAQSILSQTQSLSDLEEYYSLPQEELSHLKDCTPIFTTGRISVGVVGVFSLITLIALGILVGKKRVGRCLQAASAIVVGLLLILGIWATADFDSLFTWMHSLLFAQGTWTFSANSLLINLFPEAFWAAMAGLWILASLGCATVCALIAKFFTR